MAIYHLSTQVVKRSEGLSVVAGAAYRAGAQLTDERTGITHDYTRKPHVDGSMIYLPAQAPRKFTDRETLWNAVEQKEKRGDAQLAREINIAIPKELTIAQMQTLVEDYVQQQFVDEGMIADVCYHDLHRHNPHCHILLTMRDITAEGFGNKNRAWNNKQVLQQWRQSWTYHANDALAQAGHHARIDHRTLKAQGIDREPEQHLGQVVNYMVQRGDVPRRGIKTMLQRIRKELQALKVDVIRLMRAGRGQQNTTPALLNESTHSPTLNQ